MSKATKYEIERLKLELELEKERNKNKNTISKPKTAWEEWKQPIWKGEMTPLKQFRIGVIAIMMLILIAVFVYMMIRYMSFAESGFNAIEAVAKM